MSNKKLIAVTRPHERSQVAKDIIEENGGKVFLASTIDIELMKTKSLDYLYSVLCELDWLIITSPATIKSLFYYYPDFNEKIGNNTKIAVIGSKTGECLEEHGLSADLIPDNYTAEGLISEFEKMDINGSLIGIPRTLQARKILPESLENLGAEVIVGEAYKSVLPKDTSRIDELISAVFSNKVDAITFTSPLTVHNLFKVLDNEKKEDFIQALSNNVLTVAIGPITGNTLREYGIKYINPEKYTVKDMLKITFDNL